MRLLWLGVVGLCGRLSRKRDLRHGIAGFQLAQVVKDRLFNQPVWRAIDALRSQLMRSRVASSSFTPMVVVAMTPELLDSGSIRRWLHYHLSCNFVQPC